MNMRKVISPYLFSLLLSLILGSQAGGLCGFSYGMLVGLIAGIIVTLITWLFFSQKVITERIVAWTLFRVFFLTVLNAILLYFSLSIKIWLWGSIWVGLWIPFAVLAGITLTLTIYLSSEKVSAKEIVSSSMHEDNGNDVNDEIDGLVSEIVRKIECGMLSEQLRKVDERVGNVEKWTLIQTSSLEKNFSTTPGETHLTKPEGDKHNLLPSLSPLCYKEIMESYSLALLSESERDGFRKKAGKLKLIDYDASRKQDVYDYTQDFLELTTFLLFSGDSSGYLFLDFEKLHRSDMLGYASKNVEVFFETPGWSEPHPRVIEPAKVELLSQNRIRVLKKGKLS